MPQDKRTDLNTFIKFWLVPLVILATIFLINKAIVGLIIIGVSIFLALALNPLVRRVNNLFVRLFGNDKKHQTASAVMAYLIVVFVIGGIVGIVGPVVVNETAQFVQNFPETFERTFGGWEGVNNFGRTIGVNDLQGEITKSLDNISKDMLGILGNNLVSSVSSVADIIMKIVLVLVLTLLILLEGPTLMDKMWHSLSGHRKSKDGKNKGTNKTVLIAQRITSRMANVVSTYVSRQMMVAVLDGCAAMVIVFILSLILGLSPNLALPMGMITMIFYMIPMFGQFIGGTLVTVLLFFSNPLAALIFGVVYIIYAQIENNLIAPKVQGNALNLSPLIILCAVTIGVYMFGLLGAIIAIPIAGCIKILVEEYPNIKALRE